MCYYCKIKATSQHRSNGNILYVFNLHIIYIVQIVDSQQGVKVALCMSRIWTLRSQTVIIKKIFCASQEGVAPKELNRISKKMGFPIGLATLVDEVGIDVGAHITKYLGNVFKDRMGDPTDMINILDQFVANGYLGKDGNHIYLIFK